MSDLNEEYQEQVLDDLSDIKESVTTDSGYQEKVLDDLEDIKESVSEEQEFYDKEYQKKVLGSVRSIEKSAKAIVEQNTNYLSTIDTFLIHYYFKYKNEASIELVYVSQYSYNFFVFDISGISDFYIDLSGNTVGNLEASRGFSTNESPSNFKDNIYNGRVLSGHNFKYFSSNSDPFYVSNDYNEHYYYFMNYNDNTAPVLYYYGSNDSGDEVTTGSTVIAEGIDTLIQITTFQGFASALLTGILLFLVFVKGLRR